MLNFSLEKKLIKNNGFVVGLDEVGRGPLAGPVAVGAVIFNLDFFKKEKRKNCWWREVNDSKKLSENKRERLAKLIKSHFICAVSMESSKIIDRFGINGAIERASLKALKKIKFKKGVLLLDGNRKFIAEKEFQQELFKGGDGLVFTIACASIVAKVERDNWMKKNHKKWPEYNFCQNKGYGTAFHLKTIREIGPCPLHRLSFAPLKK